MPTPAEIARAWRAHRAEIPRPALTVGVIAAVELAAFGLLGEAAMGAVPLAMVMDGTATSMTVESGEAILSIAVLAIVVAAPVGATAIKYFGPRLLTRE